MEKHNRRSHLAPQLSPATQDLLRGSDSPLDGPHDYSSTPTSGEIPIGGADVRSAITSPREQVINTINGVRSPTKNINGSIGRSGGASFHPGLPRVQTTSSVPKVTTLNAPEQTGISGASSANAATFSLAMRPAASNGPPVPRKEISDTAKENRRQATFGVPPQNNIYGSGYPSNGGGSGY
jgi:mitogen-activated protein kinase kinase